VSEDEAPTENFTVDWVHETENDVTSAPTVSDGRVYVGELSGSFIEANQDFGQGYGSNETGYVHSINATTGEGVWSVATNGSVWSSPTVEDRAVYVGSVGGEFYSLNSSTGEELWSLETDNPVYSSPKLSDGTVYFGTRSYDAHELSKERFRFYAVDASDGELVWDTEVEEGVNGPVAVDNGTVYIPGLNGTVTALDDGTGEVRWRFETRDYTTVEEMIDAISTGGEGNISRYIDENTTVGDFSPAIRNGAVVSAPTVRNGTVYAGVYPGTVYAVNATTGEAVWKKETDPYIASSAAVTEDSVYIGTYNGSVYSFDTETGERRWVRQLPTAVTKSSPVVSGGSVYVGSRNLSEDDSGAVYVLNATRGDIVHSQERSDVFSTFAVYEDRLYFSSFRGVQSVVSYETETSVVSPEAETGATGNSGSSSAESTETTRTRELEKGMEPDSIKINPVALFLLSVLVVVFAAAAFRYRGTR
jgi:outer membrane protein assembly factor BamB